MIGAIALLLAVSQPIPRLGMCPLGYYSSGSYCIPSRGSDKEAIDKLGRSCPLGWYSSGEYCVRMR
jgi:hypothetical protein